MLNTYSGGLCLWCWKIHSNNAGSTCRHCGTSYSQDPKKSNFKKYPRKQRTVVSDELDHELDLTEDELDHELDLTEDEQESEDFYSTETTKEI